MLLTLFPPPGIGGASPPGALGNPGTGGAPANGDGADPPDVFPIIGADRSFVTAFFSCLPFVISESKAPLFPGGGLAGRFPGAGGGGGGGPPIPGMGGGGGGGGGMVVC